MDILLEALYGIFLEGYIALFSLLIPKDKMTEKKRQVIEWIIAVLMFIVLCTFVVGIGLLVENGKSTIGYILLIGSIIIFLVQLIFGILNQVLD